MQLPTRATQRLCVAKASGVGKSYDAAASLANLALCALRLEEYHTVVGAACACLRLAPAAPIAAKVSHRLALGLALLGEVAIASEVLPLGVKFLHGVSGDTVRQCADMAARVERLRVRVSGGYTVHNLGHQDAVAGGGSLAALGEIDWCGPVESFEETSLSSVRVTRDVNAGEVLLVQRPLKGTATGLHVLSRTAAVQLRLSAPGPDSLLARYEYAISKDMDCCSVLRQLCTNGPGPLLESLPRRLSPRLFPLLGQGPEYASVEEKVPVCRRQVESLVDRAVLHGPTLDWRTLLGLGAQESGGSSSRGLREEGNVEGEDFQKASARDKNCEVAGHLGCRSGLYPSLVTICSGDNPSLDNCVLAPVGLPAAGVLAVVALRPLCCGEKPVVSTNTKS